MKITLPRWVLSGARAINPERLEIDEKKCILCYACLPTCPKNMLSKYMVPGPELDMWFKNQNSHRAEPVTFIAQCSRTKCSLFMKTTHQPFEVALIYACVF